MAPDIVHCFVRGLKVYGDPFDETLYEKIRQKRCDYYDLDYDLVLANLYPEGVMEASDSDIG